MGALVNGLMRLAAACALMALTSPSLYAHELAGVSVVSAQPGIGDVVQIAIELRPRGNTECGLIVDFGDGTTEYLHAKGSSPSGTIQHIYKQAGVVVIKVEGKTKFRGLNSTFACAGIGKTTEVQISPEGYAARRAVAEEEKKATLQREREKTQAALQRAQAETQAAQAEAQRQRMRAEQATQRARSDKAVADKLARENAKQPVAVPQPTTSTPTPAPEPAAKLKPDQPKPKSTLDL